MINCTTSDLWQFTSLAEQLVRCMLAVVIDHRSSFSLGFTESVPQQSSSLLALSHFPGKVVLVLSREKTEPHRGEPLCVRCKSERRGESERERRDGERCDGIMPLRCNTQSLD